MLEQKVFVENKDFAVRKISIILPTFNERNNTPILINKISSIMKIPYEIIVVDDNSSDGTWQVVSDISRKNRNVRLLRRIGKNGIGSAIADGIKYAKGNAIVWMDVNLVHPPETIPKLVAKLQSFEIAKASRYIEGGGDERKFKRKFAARSLNVISNFLLGGIRDYTAGFLAARKYVFNKVSIDPKSRHGEYCVKFLYEARKRGISVTEVPFVMRQRGKSESKSKFSDYYSYLKLILKLGFNLT